MSVVAKRLWAERDKDNYRVLADTPEEAEAVNAYLKRVVPDLKTSGVIAGTPAGGRSFFTVPTSVVPAWRLHDALLKYPDAHLADVFNVSIAERPHYTIQPHNLAAWISDQGEDVWWSVDGDPVLMSELDFPCPPDEIAVALEKRNTPILVADPDSVAHGEELTPEDFARISQLYGKLDDALFLAWKDGAADWLLVPDEPMSGD